MPAGIGRARPAQQHCSHISDVFALEPVVEDIGLGRTHSSPGGPLASQTEVASWRQGP